MFKKRYILFLAVFFTPVLAFAAFSGIKQLLTDFGSILNSLKTLAVAAALLFFIWGLAKFIRNAGDSAAHEQGRNIMIWGLIALFVIVSVGAIINFFDRELNLPHSSGTQNEICDAITQC
ncbi:pilin [Candidatus Parcubacteria bacterium]|nr:pilin [Candidatus Parcubacteria bacterium]